jgi:hypothetical protein
VIRVYAHLVGTPVMDEPVLWYRPEKYLVRCPMSILFSSFEPKRTILLASGVTVKHPAAIIVDVYLGAKTLLRCFL